MLRLCVMFCFSLPFIFFFFFLFLLKARINHNGKAHFGVYEIRRRKKQTQKVIIKCERRICNATKRMDPFQLHFIVISCAYYVVAVPVSLACQLTCCCHFSSVKILFVSVYKFSSFHVTWPPTKMTCESLLFRSNYLFGPSERHAKFGYSITI